MKVSNMISHLQQLKDDLGDVNVLISDGFLGNFYSGQYSIKRWDDSGTVYIDIGIGMCLEDE